MQARVLFTLAVSAAIAGAAVFYGITAPSTVPAGSFKPHTADLANGRIIFAIGGCVSCHATPDQPNKASLGGGRELKTMFGTFAVPNISSDPVNGIGGWSEEQFANAVLKGVGRSGEHLYPTFPYTSYQRLTLDDVRDLFGFLRASAPEATPSKPHNLPFPFNIRRTLGVWKLLFLDGRPFEPIPSKDAAFNRGAYLIEGPGHCAECHSGRNLLGGIVAERRFAGGPNPEGRGWVPNITSHQDGIAAWSVKELAYFFETGSAPDGSTVEGEMAEVITNTAKLPPSDREAMAIYMKSLPARAGRRPPTSP